MPHFSGEYPTLALIQSVFFFCCKGMIEGIIIILFIWLLFQVLFTKNLEVHLQILLGVGLAFLCFCLIIGCILCWWRGRHRNHSDLTDKETSERIVLDPSATLPVKTTTPVKQQYEEMDGEIMDYPQHSVLSLSGHKAAVSLKPLTRGRASLPILPMPPKQSLESKTKQILERRCTLSGNCLYDEYTKLYSSSTKLVSPETMTKVHLSHTVPQDMSGFVQKKKPALQFTLFYSAYDTTLTITILGVSNLPKRFKNCCDSYVKVYLLPKFIEPQQTLIQRKSMKPKFQECFQFSGYSLEQIKSFALRLAVYAKEFHNLKETFIGEVLFPCEYGDWKLDYPCNYTVQLTTNKTKFRKCLSAQDVFSPSKTATQLKSVGHIFILLQYQSLANRIKVMVRKAEDLAKLTRMPGSPGTCIIQNINHYVIIHFYYNDKKIATKETKSASGYNPVWNAPFLFDLPPGNIQDLQVSLEFIVMQGRLYTRSSMLGCVLIGAEAPEAGHVHWKEMCNRGHVESARWHTIKPRML
ncbi:synaptotagmin-7-like [Protopterus annectens]|uniref:synaptotagmin-7-like n=1 Tax=Protopterus annectens TaxID=7888 RepID=UPI001CFBD24F|nr:synaptotagmin-7-like [Protopterus annectens]